MPRPDFRLTLDADLALKLEAYCRANENAERLPIVRKAIHAYIDERLGDDDKLNARYQDARRELLLTLPSGLHVVHEREGSG